MVACGEDFFDSITEVEIPEHEQQLAVTANFNATYGNFAFVYVGHSKGILDSTSYEIIKDAQVDLYKGDVLKHNFQFLNSNNQEDGWYRTDSITLGEGQTYTLKVTDETYGTVEATQTVPNIVPVLSGTFEANNVIDRYGDRRDEVTIEFQDPKGIQNYYTVNIGVIYRFENEDTSFVARWFSPVFPVDPILDDLPYGGLFLSDASFDGERYTLRFGTAVREQVSFNNRVNEILSGPPEKIVVTLTAVSKDYYLFRKTLSTYYDNEDNPFAEPVVIHNNIEGGNGIFTLNISNEFEIDL